MDEVLVTGGAGFIGRHLALLLHHQGYQVTALDRVGDANAAHGRQHLESEGIAVVEGSTGDQALMRRLVRGHRVVVHLAAPIVGVQQNLRTPGSQADALHDATVLASMLTVEHRLLFSSTSDVYGLHSVHYGDKPMAEDDLTVYESPSVSRWNYAKAKALSESVFACSAARTVSVRIFNAYGPGLDYPQARRVIAQFVTAVFAGQPLRISGSGGQRRAYCYISDLVDGIGLALGHAANLPVGGNLAVNLGNPDEYVSVHDLARLVCDLAVGGGFVAEAPAIERSAYTYSEPFDDTWSRRPDITRARRLLGYEPSMGLHEGITRVLGFHAARTSAPTEPWNKEPSPWRL
ncbi:NAD(P)-dependent oxidoreductase [Streptacidiphilus sp. P02-A3a]|uniref:NAD-dependent epimerase/dehydratase family protein n=1 Tax=Streptacidiphilus sp. P02-A3a TaxID=2704468 RepID=UPI0015FD9ADC|nr:NAD(P)-dependent oxidoreductase [Streptacidiphilus sp. P02-A3a]QMU72032.1 NAD(P)-dependent oxidoreductase [Streptacidiphilus sp. P02-A3a]